MYRIIKSPPFEAGESCSYWIEQTKRVFFGLFKTRKTIGAYEFDTGGAIATMPFFDKKEAEQHLKALQSCL